MQATATRTAQVRQTLLVPLILLAGLILGGAGGYFINDLTRVSPTTAGAWTSSPATDYTQGIVRHAAAERADALYGDVSLRMAKSVARHAAQERAEASSIP